MSALFKPSERKVKAASSSRASAKKAPKVRVAKNIYRRQIVQRLAKVFSYTFISLLGVYLCFAATIIRVIPSFGDLPPTVVKNNTYPGGVVPPGGEVVVSLEGEQGNGIGDYLKQAFMPTDSAALVEVVAGPFGRLTWAESGLVTVDGAPMPVTLQGEPENDFLSGEYLVKCLDGPCKEGAGLIIPSGNIYGQPL